MIGADILDIVRELGGELTLEGDKLRYRLPDCPESRELLEQVRRDREAIKALLRGGANQPPSLQEVQAGLPPGVRLLSYRPKQVPFAVAPVSIVTDVGKFFRAYLRDLRRRLEDPDTYATPPLAARACLRSAANSGSAVRTALARTGLTYRSCSSP
jgi:hypothetical protein